MSRGRLCGEIGINSIDSKLPYVKNGKTKGGNDYTTFSCSVIAAKNNRAYVELFGMATDTIETYNTENEKIEISWKDRFDEDILSTVASYRKHIVCLVDHREEIAELEASLAKGEEVEEELDKLKDEQEKFGRKEFISSYDVANYLSENVDILKSGRYIITVNINKNVYNGSISDRFQIQNIYPAKADDKNKLQITTEFFWTSEGVDSADWKDEKKVRLNGYTYDYIDKNTLGTEKSLPKYVEKTLVFDASKIDYDNEKHVALKDFKLLQMGLAEKDDKIVINLKKNKVYKLTFICNYINGSEEVAFDESMLTPNQKMAIEVGAKTLDDFRPSGSVFGERIVEYKIVDFNLRDEGADGAYIADITVKELEEEIFVPSKKESVDVLDEDEEEETAVTSEEDDDEDDLFS